MLWRVSTFDLSFKISYHSTFAKLDQTVGSLKGMSWIAVISHLLYCKMYENV